jgi:hypothetical protein
LLSVYRLTAHACDDALVDQNGDAFARLGVQDAAQYLVRPDGYVAFRCAGRRFETLEQYLAAWYIHQVTNACEARGDARVDEP